MKINLIGLAARDSALKGVSDLGKAIRSTIGPFGQNFLIDKEGGKSTNDGFITATALVPSIKNEFERQGARLALEATSKTNDQVGDATSTATALVEAITKESLRYLPNENTIKAKKTPSEIKRMIDLAKDTVINELEQSAVPITTKEDLVKSALVSVEEEPLARLLGETQWELGPEGFIIAEEVNESISSIERVKGIRLDNGFGTSMAINNQEKGSLELQDIPIFLTNYTIDSKELQILNEQIFKPLVNQKKLGIVLVARAFTPNAIKFCMESLQTGFSVFPVNAPYVNQTQIMQDIACVVGGRHVDIEGSRLEDVDVSDVGFAKRFMARIFDGIVTGEDNEQSKERTQKRIEDLKLKLKGAHSDFDRKMIESRIAQISNGFAILKVGSDTVVNRRRLKDKADDGVNAVRLALKGGTVKGGGLAFKEISEKLEEGNILKRPLNCIYEQIINSAPEGFVIEDWVRDPMLILKSALTNACDVAAVLTNVNGAITEKNPRERKEDEEGN